MGPILARSNSSLTPGRYKLGTTKRGETRLWIPQATPDKAFRIFVTLVRDQEVDGSNPFAPTTSLEPATYRHTIAVERVSCGSERQSFESPIDRKSVV